MAKIFSHTEEEADGHSTLLIKDFYSFEVDWTVVTFKIQFQDLKKSSKLYIVHDYFIGE